LSIGSGGRMPGGDWLGWVNVPSRAAAMLPLLAPLAWVPTTSSPPLWPS